MSSRTAPKIPVPFLMWVFIKTHKYALIPNLIMLFNFLLVYIYICVKLNQDGYYIYLGMRAVDIQSELVPDSIAHASKDFKSEGSIHVASAETTAIDHTAVLQLQGIVSTELNKNSVGAPRTEEQNERIESDHGGRLEMNVAGRELNGRT